MIWDWIESSSMSKEITAQPLLPSNTSSYGQLCIVDNSCPIIQRTFTASNCTATQVELLISYAKLRDSCFKIHTALSKTYTGRFINYAAQQTRGADHWQLSMVLQDIDAEASGTAQAVYEITDQGISQVISSY